MEYLLVRHGLAVFASWGAAYYLIPRLAQAAFRFGVLDRPDGNIKNHQAPVPYMGGLAIYSAFVLTLGLVYPFENKIMWLLLGSTLLMLVGFIDDLKNLSPAKKMLGQICGVICFLRGGVVLKEVFFASWFNTFFTIGWMLSVINAFNLIDIMDGLSSLVAIIATMAFLVVTLLLGQHAISLLLCAFLGALIAFFMWNKPPAKIYMGDAGALFVGGFLSAIPLLIKWSSVSWDTYYAPGVILAIPLVEVACLIVIRTYKKIPFYRGSPHHFAIYLQNKGFSRWQVLGFTGVMGVYLAIAALCFMFNVIYVQGLLAAGLGFGALWYGVVFSGLFVKPGSKYAARVVPAVRVARNERLPVMAKGREK